MAQDGFKGESQMRSSKTRVLQTVLLDEHLGIMKAKSINSSGLDSCATCMSEFCWKYCVHFVNLSFPKTVSHTF